MKFKDERQQRIYDLFASPDRPTVSDGCQAAFRRGRAGVEARYHRGSLAYAAWAAGRDVRKKEIAQ